MKQEHIVLGAISAAFTLLLMLLFGFTGTAIAIVLIISTASAYKILEHFEIEHDYSLALSIPLGIISISSLSYGLGFIIGLKNALFASLGILIVASYLVTFLKKHKQKT